MARRKKKKDNLKLLAFIFAITLVFTYNYFNNKDSISNSIKEPSNEVISSNLEVYFLDVGQADSILISNKDHHILIDAGNNEDGPLLVNYIKELGISKFDLVVGTHPHEDHIGGLDNIIDNFDIDNIYLPDVITTTKTFEELIDSISNKNLEITIPKINDTLSLGDITIEVISSNSNQDNLNDSSLVLKLTYGSNSFLFTGDISSEVEKAIIDKNIDVDVLKVSHHGSSSSTSTNFLKKVTPSHAIISVAKKNTYNHPSISTINRIKEYTNNLYITSELGTIKVTSNGKDINVTNFNTNTNG